MRDVTTEIKELRMSAMVSAWTELMTQGQHSLESSRWLIEHLLQAEQTERAIAEVRHQLYAAKFPAHRDLAGFDLDSCTVDQSLIKQLATL